MPQRCLGKLPAKADVRRLMMSAYTSAKLPPPPATSDRTYGISPWGLMANDRLGDCAYASVGHMQMAWSMGASKKAVVITDAEIIAAYTATGYNPTTGAHDDGSNLIEVQEQWRSVGIAGNKILGYTGLDLRTQLQIMQAVYYFGGAYIGVNLPQSAEQQTDAGLTWTVPWFSPIIGGHAIPILSYDATHVWAVTWGQVQAITWEFISRYCDEAYAIVDPLWIEANGEAPDSGLNITTLVADLGAVNAKAAPLPSVRVA
jgi:hypothetical protein